jgi:hypothetical protein
VAVAAKVYDFPLAKVEDQLVSYLKKKSGESTIADMIAGTGLPKYQVEQAAKAALDEYAGRLKVTESGELLYYFPSGMHSTLRGFRPGMRRFWNVFSRQAARVLTLLFKIWIVTMLVGYFVLFLAIGVLAIVASFAASAANKDGNKGGGRDRGGGFGGMYLAMRLLDMLLRMWFWSSILKDPRQKKPKEGRAFYKEVFGFVFGDGDPNQGWDEAERKHVITYIRSHKGVITLEEFMALTGQESDRANSLLNRFLLEFEGEPGVTENGTVIYTFAPLMRASESELRSIGQASLLNPASRRLIPFSLNKKRTNGWITFFNVFNLAFGSYFLVISITQGAAALAKSGPFLYAFTGSLLHNLTANPVPGMAIGLGLVPVAFSVVFFLVPLIRKLRLDRRNAAIRNETLRRRVLAQILSSPSRVDARDVRPTGTALDPKDLPAAASRMVERLAAAMSAEPIVQDQEGVFAYRFTEIEREMSDLASHRDSVDLKRYELGKTVFDSGN